MLAIQKCIFVEATRRATVCTASTTAAKMTLSPEIIQNATSESENDDVHVVVRALQQHFTFEIDELALLCEDGTKLHFGRVGTRETKTWCQKHTRGPVEAASKHACIMHKNDRSRIRNLLAALRVPFNASKMFAHRSSSKSFPARRQHQTKKKQPSSQHTARTLPLRRSCMHRGLLQIAARQTELDGNLAVRAFAPQTGNLFDEQLHFMVDIHRGCGRKKTGSVTCTR